MTYACGMRCFLLVALAITGCIEIRPLPAPVAAVDAGPPEPEIVTTVYRAPRPQEEPKVPCKERFAEKMAAAVISHNESVEREQERINKMCVESVARTTVISSNHPRHEGPTRRAWICNGTPYDHLPVARGNRAVLNVQLEIMRCESGQ